MKKPTLQKGFTLIEMLVNIFIFSLILTVSLGSILVVLDSNRKAQSIKTAVDNLNFAMETMSRDLRFGMKYSCEGVTDCPLGGDSVTAQSNRDVDGDNDVDMFDTITYDLIANPQDSNVYQIVRSLAGGPNIAMTAPELKIEHLEFYVTGAPSLLEGNTEQPKILITIKGYAETGRNVRTDFNLQTTVSQRCYDVGSCQ